MSKCRPEFHAFGHILENKSVADLDLVPVANGFGYDSRLFGDTGPVF
jgi:hypothetical protein